MADEYKVRYSYVIWELIRSHFFSNILVNYLAFLVMVIVSVLNFGRNGADSEGILSGLFTALISPLIVIPFSFVFAIPSAG